MVIKGKQLLVAGVVLVLFGALAVGFWYYFRPTEKNKIREQFRAFSEQVAKKGNEGPIAAVGTARTVAKLFTNKTTFELEGLSWTPGPHTQEDIAADVLRARSLFSTLKLSFGDIEIEISDKTARVIYSAVLSGKLRDGKDIREVRELESILKKKGTVWLFDSFKAREIIKK